MMGPFLVTLPALASGQGAISYKIHREEHYIFAVSRLEENEILVLEDTGKGV